MNHLGTISYESVSLWVSLASLLVSIAAVWIAKSSLSRAEDSLRQAERVADRDLRDWRQRTWFDLFVIADEVHTSLLFFKTEYGSPSSPPWGNGERQQDFNNLVTILAKAYTKAVVFPINPATDEFFSSVAAIKSGEDALSEELLNKIFDSVEKIRQKALIHPGVLG